jgi:hypothetical protein
MTDYPAIIFAGLLIFIYGLISRVSERSPITPAMVFAGIGILAGPMALSLSDVRPGAGDGLFRADRRIGNQSSREHRSWRNRVRRDYHSGWRMRTLLRRIGITVNRWNDSK